MTDQENRNVNNNMGDITGIAFGHAVHDTYSGFLPPMLPVIIEKLSLSNTQAGLLSFSLQGVSVIQPFIGNLADKVNLRYLVILAPGITATMMSLIGIAPAYILLIFLMIITGLSSAGIHTVGPAVIGKLSERNLGLGMSIWMAGGELGRVLGPLVIVSAIRYFSLESTPFLMIFGWTASLFLFFRLRNISIEPATQNQSLPWKKILSQMRPILLPLAGILTFSGFLLGCINTYLPVYLTDQGADVWLAGVSLSVLETAGVIGVFTAGWLSDRIGRKRILLIAFALSPLSMLLFIHTRGLPQIAILLLLGFTSISTTPVMMALAQENFPENRAFANGTYNALSFAIRSLDIVLVGIVSDLLGIQPTFYISAFIMMLCVPIAILLPGLSKSIKIS